MNDFDRRVLKKEGEELQQYLHFRKRGSVVENKKKNKKHIRKQNKDACRNADY
jgi:hypothetical protein